MIENPSKDLARADKDLRSRVKLLGQLVGNTLIANEHPDVFDTVEI